MDQNGNVAKFLHIYDLSSIILSQQIHTLAMTTPYKGNNYELKLIVDYVHLSKFFFRLVWRLYPKPKARNATTRVKTTIWKCVGMAFYSLSPTEMKINANVNR